MKKIYLSFLALICYAVSYGTVVTADSAKVIGANFLSQHGIAANVANMQLTYTSGSGAVNYFYVFSTASSFVMVSADDAVKPIIGYSTERPFNANMPSQISGWFGGYENQIEYVINHNIAATADITTQWSNLRANIQTNTAAKTTLVSPMLATTWDQSPDYINQNGYYNDNCPYDGGAGANCVTGCVATATAQVMKFWNWPVHGIGSNSYVTNSYGTLYADYGATTYNWSSMPNSLNGHNAAIAGLMSDVGIGVDMEYTPTESSSYVISSQNGTPPNCAEYALKTYFNYDPTLHGEQRSDYSDATWISMLESNLDAGEPVIYTGQGTAGGHCFVFDGYEANNYFHVNWGWSGSDDGYFTIDALNPGSLGTGGGAGGFNSDQTAIFGIKPNNANNTQTNVSSGIYLYDYVTPSASTIFYDNPFSVTTNIWNESGADYTGYVGAAAFNGAGTFVGFIQELAVSALPNGDVFTTDLNFSTAGMLSMLPGTYSIGIFYYDPADSQWIAVSDTDNYVNYAQVTVVNNNYLELYDTMLATPNPLVQNAAASVTLNVVNNNASTSTGTLDLSLYTVDSGLFVCNINEMPYSLDAYYQYSSDLTFSTSSVNAPPGTYLLALEFNDGTGWYLAGSDYFQNPTLINVAAAPLSPDVYEADNTAATAYQLPLSFSGNTASVSTTGSNFHIPSDQDYYKLVLPAGYSYVVNARVNDSYNTNDGQTYTVDAAWTYSTDNGATWSTVYDDVMTGPSSINLGNGGTVIFHVSPKFLGDIGTYLLKISSVTRAPLSIPNVELSNTIQIFPNPANEFVTIDLSHSAAQGIEATISSIDGKKLSAVDMSNKQTITLPVNSFAPGIYLVEVQTDKGTITKKITVTK